MATTLAQSRDPRPSSAAAGGESVLFDEIPRVETASLYVQTLQEAPANVTVVTEQDIRRFGYRTLAEVLANVRGMYVSSDGGYAYVGVRGFNLPGDYNTRILVLVNGHYLTDAVYSAMYLFGQDFGIDIDLIQRIEIVRGPSSSVYGSNGVFATVNIFTRAPVDSPAAAVNTTIGSFGQGKMQAAVATYLGRGVNLLLSASGFYTGGRELDAPPLGRTGHVDANHGYHAFAQLTRGDWSLTANFADRKALGPLGWYRTDFGDPGTSLRDGRNYIESSWNPTLSDSASLRWSVYYDQFRYYGVYHTTPEGEPTQDNRDYAGADWIGTRLTYHSQFARTVKLTLGGQFDADLQNAQQNRTIGQPGLIVDISRRQRSYGVFVQQEWEMAPGWTLFLGGRLDDSTAGKPVLSPKIALVRNAGERSAYKLIYGQAFRNPSTFERYWSPNPALNAEKMHTFEFAREKDLGRNLDMVASVYHYRLSGLIEGVPISPDTLQYQNVENSHAIGAEVELRGHIRRTIETAASASLQRVRYRHGRELPNSPEKIVQFRLAAPLVSSRLWMGFSARYVSRRLSPAGWDVPGVPVADLTFTTNRLHRDFDLQLGARNLFDRRYFDPMSAEHSLPVLQRAGRSVFVKLIWHYGE